jgi:hypothetical protein
VLFLLRLLIMTRLHSGSLVFLLPLTIAAQDGLDVHDQKPLLPAAIHVPKVDEEDVWQWLSTRYLPGSFRRRMGRFGIPTTS